jgi:hypothetical protein
MASLTKSKKYFEKTLLLNGKSIKQGKGRIKAENRLEGKGVKDVFFSIH